MEVMSTFRRRLLVALGVGVLLALLEIGGFLRESLPTWLKVAFSATVIAIGVGGGLAGATLGRDKRLFVVALLLIVVAEAMTATVLANAA